MYHRIVGLRDQRNVAQKRSRFLVGYLFHNFDDDAPYLRFGAHARLDEHFVEGVMDDVSTERT